MHTVAGIKADLRSLATALETYFVDHNAYPTELPALTTPIAYMTKIPVDPYSKEGAQIKLITSEKADDWKTYSVGPDGEDQNGEIEYDPTNGTISGGDVIRVKQ